MRVHYLTARIALTMMFVCSAHLYGEDSQLSELLGTNEASYQTEDSDLIDTEVQTISYNTFGGGSGCDVKVGDCDCGGKGKCDSCCGRSRTVYFGVEATFLTQVGGNNNRLTWNMFDFTTSPDPVLSYTSSVPNANNQMIASPRLWLGVVGCRGWGAQVRYWSRRNCATAFDPYTPFKPGPSLSGDDRGFNASSCIQMYTFDAEATRELCYGCWDMLATIGYRHARLAQNQSLAGNGMVVFDPDAGDIDFFSGSALSFQKFEGDGLTFSLSGIRPTGRGFGLYFNARGSVLWGRGAAGALASSQFVNPNAGGAVIAGAEYTGALAKSNSSMFIGEIQAGIQWSRCITSFNARMFARVGFEYQYWNLTNGPYAVAAAATGEGDPADPLTALITTANSGSDHLSLIGVAASTGFVW